ncbi:hypothetical protein AUC71_00735 [Methyloceanibacter marginalis]|uniref:Uncharacterized protein n=1 Tax=Methyloceanibacter marginalis TaxID=1774971 RepID=A0A1E3WCS7_9HYPH|nr:hypothetical protein AUC71_00735 [Methyloceanibacter marginalis]
MLIALVGVLRLAEIAGAMLVFDSSRRGSVLTRDWVITMRQTMSSAFGRRKGDSHGRSDQGKRSENRHRERDTEAKACPQCCNHSMKLAIRAGAMLLPRPAWDNFLRVFCMPFAVVLSKMLRNWHDQQLSRPTKALRAAGRTRTCHLLVVPRMSHQEAAERHSTDCFLRRTLDGAKVA